MKKIVSLLLLSALCFSVVLAGCSATPEIPEEEEGRIYFYDATFTIMTAWPEEFRDKAGSSTTNDKMMQRYADLKSEYGVNIDFLVSGYDDADIIMLQNQIAGRGCAELVDCSARDGYAMYKSSMIVPLEEVNGIDLTNEKWGTPVFRVYGKFDGKDYGFYSYYWENIPQVSGILFSNTALFERFNLDDPHELIEKGDWTWETFRNILAQSTFKDGEISYKGLISGNNVDLLKSAIFSNGGEFISENNGFYTCNLESSQASAAFDYILSLSNAGCLDSDGGIEAFTVDQTSPFYFGESHYGTIYTTSSTAVNNPTLLLDSYGMLQFPHGPSGAPGTVSSFVHGGRRLFFVSDVTNWDTDEIGTVSDLLFEPLPGSEESGWKYIASTYVFHYDEDFNDYVNTINNVRYDYSSQMNSTLENDFESILQSGLRGDITVTEAVQTALPLILEALGQNG